jgi:molecular chaperone DnaK
VRNKADQAVYGTERMIKDSGDKLTAADREAIEAACNQSKRSTPIMRLTSGGAGAVDGGAALRRGNTLQAVVTRGGAGAPPPGGPDQTGQPGGSGATTIPRETASSTRVVDEGK